MAAGTHSFMGMAVPLRGQSTIIATTTSADILTIEGSSTTPTGDYLVCRYGGGNNTEKFVVAYDGSVTAAGGISMSGNLGEVSHLTFSTAITTKPAGVTGWTAGDVFVAIPSSGIPVLGIATAVGTTTPTCYYFMPTTQTFAYSTMPK